MFGIHPTHSANAWVEVGKELTRRFRQIDGNEETFAHKLITQRLPQGKMFGYDGEPSPYRFHGTEQAEGKQGTIKSGGPHCCESSRDQPDT